MSLKHLADAISREGDMKVRDRMQAVYSVHTKINEQKVSKAEAVKITALELRMSVTSVKTHLRNYREYSVRGLYDLPRSGAPHIYEPKIVDAAIAELEREGPITPRRLAARVQKLQKSKVRMSRGHARRLLRDKRKSPKKAQHVNVAAAKPHKVYRWRTVFLPLILVLRALGYTIAVGDEMMISQDANGDAVYWSDVGVPVKVPYVGDHDKVTALGITTEPDKDGRARRCHVTAKSANTESFIDLLDKAFKAFGPLVVIVDRAGWHNSNELKKYLRGMNGRVIVILLPVGSAYMNAKEQDWNQTKLADFYSDYYPSIGKKEDAMIMYLDTMLNPNLNIWKYLIRSPYAYRRGLRRRKSRYGMKGPLQYIIDRYQDVRSAQEVVKITTRYCSDYIYKD